MTSNLNNGTHAAAGVNQNFEQKTIASIYSNSKGLATLRAYNETTIGNKSLLIKMKDVNRGSKAHG